MNRLHLVAAIVHGLVAVTLIALAFTTDLVETSKLPLARTTVGTPENAMRYDTDMTSIGEVSMYPFLLAFPIITCAAHLLQTFRPIQTPNKIRWIEYAITAPLMIFLLGALSGVRAIDTLLLLVIMTSVVMLGGYFGEKPGGGPKIIQVASWVLFAATWAVIATTFLTHVEDAKNADSESVDSREPPSWLWAILIIEFVLFGCFGLVPFLKEQQRRETAYPLLSLASKTLLVGMVTAGLIT